MNTYKSPGLIAPACLKKKGLISARTSSIPRFPGSCSSVSLKIMMDPSAPPPLKTFSALYWLRKSECKDNYPNVGEIPMASWKLRRRAAWACNSLLDNCSKQLDLKKKLTPSPHWLSNRFPIKSSLMDSRKSHGFDLLPGKAAITVRTSASTFEIELQVQTNNERKRKDESSPRFLESHWRYTLVGNQGCFDSKNCHHPVVFYIRVFAKRSTYISSGKGRDRRRPVRSVSIFYCQRHDRFCERS